MAGNRFGVVTAKSVKIDQAWHIERSTNDLTIKDLLNSNVIPFTIKTAAPVDSVYVGTAGVGIWNNTPDSKLTIGRTTSGAQPSATADIHIIGLDGGFPGIYLDSFGAVPYITGRRAQGTNAAKTAVTTGVSLLRMQASGYKATGYSADAVSIDLTADGTWTDTSVPTAIIFKTVASGTTTLTERMRIDNAGNIGVGFTTPRAKLHLVKTANTTAYTQSASYLHIGGTADIAVGSTHLIGFGYDDGVLTNQPAYLGYLVESTAGLGGGFGSLVFGTRSVGTDTLPTERMKIDGAGRVGIGDSPLSTNYGLLQVGSRTGLGGWNGANTIGIVSIFDTNKTDGNCANLRIMTTDAAAQNVGGSLCFGGNYATTTSSVDFAVIAGRRETGTPGDPDGYLTFQTRGGGATSERMRIASTGSILMGVTTGTGTGGGLNITSAIALSTGGGSFAGGTMRVFSSENAANDVGGSIVFGGNTGKAAAIMAMAAIRAGRDNTTAADYCGNLQFMVSSSNGATNEVMRCSVQTGATYSGVGIGKAPGINQALDLQQDTARKATTTTWATGSDSRLKTNIVAADLSICYNVVKNLPLKRFAWDATVPFLEVVEDRNAVGWIAQDVQSVLPNAVTSRDEHGITGCLSLQPDQIYKMMYGALQKLMVDHEVLKSDYDIYVAAHP